MKFREFARQLEMIRFSVWSLRWQWVMSDMSKSGQSLQERIRHRVKGK